MLHLVKHLLKQNKNLSPKEYKKAKALYESGLVNILSLGLKTIQVLLIKDEGAKEISLELSETGVYWGNKDLKNELNEWVIAALLSLEEELEHSPIRPELEGISYTWYGMRHRVLKERKEKAAKAQYKIKWANNIFGEHTLINEKGHMYKVTLRDFEQETGYIDNPDLRTNRLGTTKHIIYAFDKLKSDKKLYKKLAKTYPFVEIHTDPLNDYQISWYYPHELDKEVSVLIKKYFGQSTFIKSDRNKDFLSFIREASHYEQILIRPEVEDAVRKAWENEVLSRVEKQTNLDLSVIKVPLFPYQEEGVRFATFKSAAILADEMGLGKTVQAVATAVMKKRIFEFKKTLIICPASLKAQWQQEISKFCEEQAEVAEGTPQQREAVYRNSQAYFIIVNYETVLRDLKAINAMSPDLVILDEAQKIKNFSTITAQSIKLLKRKHALILTGTPMENKLVDLYSVVQFADPDLLSPLWDFSYRYCFFDEKKLNKITGYFNLQDLHERLKPILLRREKRKVIKDLPKVTEITLPVSMHLEQQMMHANFAKGVASILCKKHITPYDQQKLMLLLNNMRMVCDSTFLIDKETMISPKLQELEEILTEKLSLAQTDGKVLIFSEWVTMLELIGKKLKELNIGYTTLSGKVPVKDRNKLVKQFESDPACKVFLSSEAGGAGLNLQIADTVINFELPWNPAKKNQRIGRIDRLGQRSKKLTVINLITRHSFEESIASGLMLKQNLFEGVLNDDSNLDVVDFSKSGKAQFLLELEQIMQGFSSDEAQVVETEQTDNALAKEIGKYTELDLTDEHQAQDDVNGSESQSTSSPKEEQAAQLEQMEKVMNNGLQFLSGMFKMATGKDMALEDQKIEIDRETGEVVMRFKMPKL